jgi:hypothetical protein
MKKKSIKNKSSKKESGVDSLQEIIKLAIEHRENNRRVNEKFRRDIIEILEIQGRINRVIEKRVVVLKLLLFGLGIFTISSILLLALF